MDNLKYIKKVIKKISREYFSNKTWALLTMVITFVLTIRFAFAFSNDSTLVIVMSVILCSLTILLGIFSIVFTQKTEAKIIDDRVFIIYAKEDADIAKSISSQLHKAGLKPWLDVERILPGQNWKDTIKNELSKSAIAVLLVSKNTNKRGFVQEELNLAYNTLKQRVTDISPIIPIRLDNSSVPGKLSSVQWVDINKKSDMVNLVSALKKVAKEKTP